MRRGEYGNILTMEQRWQNSEFVDWYNRSLGFSQREIEKYIGLLGLNPGDVLVDIGCGNGEFLLHASKAVKKAVGIDESAPQIELARQKLKGVKNVELINSGFQDCRFGKNLFTRGFARKTLHHLTDDEKEIFFKKLSASFAKNGILLIEDMIFDFDKSMVNDNRGRILTEALEYYGEKWEEMESAFWHTVCEEYPTGFNSWKKALESAGFKIARSARKNCFYGIISAEKTA